MPILTTCMSLVGSGRRPGRFRLQHHHPHEHARRLSGPGHPLRRQLGQVAPSCAYDPLGNPLAVTDPRGFTTRFDRNELGKVYRTTSPAPYSFQVESYYDANRNVVRVDTKISKCCSTPAIPPAPATPSLRPAAAWPTCRCSRAPAARFARAGSPICTPSTSWTTRRSKTSTPLARPRPAWLPATCMTPTRTWFRSRKPEGNLVEYDYDERNLRIAQRVGYVAGDDEITPAVTITAYDANGNELEIIGPADRGGTDQRPWRWQTPSAPPPRSPTPATRCCSKPTTDSIGSSLPATRSATSTSASSTRATARSKCKPKNASTVVLAQSETRFDEAGRPYEGQQDVFLADRHQRPLGPRNHAHWRRTGHEFSTANGHTATVTISPPVRHQLRSHPHDLRPRGRTVGHDCRQHGRNQLRL